MEKSSTFLMVSGDELEQMIARVVQESIIQLTAQQNHSAEAELITRKEAAQLLGISLPTLRDYTERGIVTGYRVGTRVRYKKCDMLDCLRKVQTSKYRAA